MGVIYELYVIGDYDIDVGIVDDLKVTGNSDECIADIPFVRRLVYRGMLQSTIISTSLL